MLFCFLRLLMEIHWSMEKTLKNALCYSKEPSPLNGLECQAYVKILIHQQWQLLHISEKFSKRTKKSLRLTNLLNAPRFDSGLL